MIESIVAWADVHMPNVVYLWEDLWESVVQTLIMLGIAGAFSLVLGVLLGILLVVTADGGLYAHPVFHSALSKIINVFRSLPFVILIALLVPVTRYLVGTSIGIRGTILPLVLGIIPFMSRLVEQALADVDPGVIEMAQSMGLSRRYIVLHVLLKESLPGLTRALVTTTISLLGLTTMAGAVGGGGVGSFAIRYGYNRFMNDITLVTVVILLIFVNVIQGIGNLIIKKLTH
ncbi:MAG: methionine ABC transporter permease [Aristaeellaceae bacterium]